MTIALRSEYVGFTVDETSRIYTMRVRKPGVVHEFRIAVPNRFFLANRVRYQDAPDLCFLKLASELERCGEGTLPEPNMEITDAELDAYREAHTPKPPPPRPRFPSPVTPSETDSQS